MLFGHCNPFFDGRRRKFLSGLHIMLDLAEYPGISDACTTDHDSVHTITVFVFNRFFRRVDVSVAKNRNMHSWIGFDLTRSEEHTSELQSRGHLVCRLLLEKKKTKNKRRYVIA